MTEYIMSASEWLRQPQEVLESFYAYNIFHTNRTRDYRGFRMFLGSELSRTSRDLLFEYWRERPYLPRWFRVAMQSTPLFDLSHEDLSGIDLSSRLILGADFSNANLTNAHLHRTDFVLCSFRGTRFDKSDLSYAWFGHPALPVPHRCYVTTDLTGASFRGANLTNANLPGCRLVDVDLREAVLVNANFWRALFADIRDGSRLLSSRTSTNFAGATLTGSELGRTPAMGIQFLDLALAGGLDRAKVTDQAFLDRYSRSVFSYAHSLGTQDRVASHTIEVVRAALARMSLLQSLYSSPTPDHRLVLAVETISSELIKYLRLHPRALYTLRPRQFEELVAEVLASFGWRVELTPPTRDGGFDIFAISRNETGLSTSWVIECKKYAPENRVTVDIARGLYAVKTDIRAANALLATTSWFTRGVREFKAERYDFELRDFEGIVDWLARYRS